MQLPDPALVVLVGASGAGKSTWAATRYRDQEIVSSDALRGIVGSGPHDLDASVDAFAVLETIVAARLGRGLTTVVDTLGLDAARRRTWLTAARTARLPAVVVLLDTPDAECRRRNAARDRPVPAQVLTGQLRSARDVRAVLEAEGWDLVEQVAADTVASDPTPARRPASHSDRTSSLALRTVLQVSRFPWGEDPLAWLTGIARAADEAGFAGLALMDHLIQVPQVGRAWEPIPEPWVTLGAVAALGTDLVLGMAMTRGLLEHLDWRGILIALALVLVVRPLAGWVALSTLARPQDREGGLDRGETMAVAFFGVRGVGSLFYLAYATSHEHVPGEAWLWSTVAFTVIVSVLLHGVTATPAMARLDARRGRTSTQG